MTLLKTLLTDLIKFESVTPHDAGCQAYLMDHLSQWGFTCQPFNQNPVSNFFARKGSQAPLLVFAGHTDVVTPGQLSAWETDPFVLTERAGRWIGRGVADMKGAVAAFLSATKRFIDLYPAFPGSIGFLITSGEEGDQYLLGTPVLMEALKAQGVVIDACLVGEPSSTAKTGDMIKIGRRGSLSGRLHLQGKQGHVAYPDLAVNPIHAISDSLQALAALQFDTGNAHFPPTTFQITYIQAGSAEAKNVIPGELVLHFNCRFSTEQSVQTIQEKIKQIFVDRGLDPTIDWQLSGEPFLTAKGRLLDQTMAAIEQCTGNKADCSTSGGTSDGRFIAPYGVEVIELGLPNATIHQANESVDEADLYALEKIYFTLLTGFFG